MRKKILKSTTLALLFVMLTGTASVLAGTNYYGSFTFSFAYAVNGTTEFELNNCGTTARGRANTYEYAPDSYGDYVVVTEKKDYMFRLNEKGLFGESYETAYMLADGYVHIHSFSEIDKGTYTVDVTSNEKLGSMNRRIIGTGAVEQ